MEDATPGEGAVLRAVRREAIDGDLVPQDAGLADPLSLTTPALQKAGAAQRIERVVRTRS